MGASVARDLVVEFQGAVSHFGLRRVSREKLYGRKRRMMVDESDNVCVAAVLTRDGSALLPLGSTADLYVDDAFDTVERADLIAVDDGGEPLERVGSTLGVVQALSDPVSPQRVLDHVTTAVYALDPDEVDPTLAERLAAGAIFETRFAFRDGYQASPAFLLQNGEGVFALVGAQTRFEPVRREALPEIGDDPFDDGELDFTMF